MKNLRFTVVLLLLILSVVFLSACYSGGRARDQAASLVLPGSSDVIYGNIQRGMEATSNADSEFNFVAAVSRRDRFFNAVDSGMRPRLISDARPLWDEMSAFAMAGISDKLDKEEIGLGVAASLIENVVRFEELLFKLTTTGGP